MEQDIGGPSSSSMMKQPPHQPPQCHHQDHYTRNKKDRQPHDEQAITFDADGKKLQIWDLRD